MTGPFEGSVEKSDSTGTEVWTSLPRQGGAHSPPELTPSAVKASPEELDLVYRQMLKNMALRDHHQKALAQRGFAPEKLAGFSFGSLTKDSRKEAKGILVERYADFLTSVPGFYVDQKGLHLGGLEGLLIPCRDLQGRIQAIVIRHDQEEGQRYGWMTSKHKGGPSSGSPAAFYFGSEPKVVLITEGQLKAALASVRLGVSAIGVAGVDRLASEQVRNWLGELSPEKVILAPDADAFTKESVSRATIKAVKMLDHLAKTAKFELVVAIWERSQKGIDDALLAEAALTPLSPEDYLARLLEAAQLGKADDGPGEVAEAEALALPILDRAILALGGNCDGAQDSDGVGFNSRDTSFFKPHLEAVKEGLLIAPSLRKKVLERLGKYSSQLLDLGFNINKIHDEEQRLGKEAKESRSEDREPTQVDKLLELAEDWKLLKDGGNSFASMVSVNKDGEPRRETWRFYRGGVRQKLLHLYFLDYSSCPSSEALAQVMSTLEAKANFEGELAKVWLRTAYEDQRVYLDLCNELGQVVAVSEAGWELTTDPPVYFQRIPSMLPLPVPERGGSLLDILPFVNLDRQGFILAMAWVLHSLFPETPHAILLLEGGQGTGKSSLARILRSLFDPNSIPFRKAPRDDEDLAVCAANNWAVVYDNLSRIPGPISDALCGVSTGSGHARRAHYSNDEEAAFSYLRPVMLTGLPGLSGKSDLAERILKIELATIPETERKLESKLNGDGQWDKVVPRVLGALLDGVSCSLRNVDRKPLERLPRMADFAQFVVNAGDALPWSDEEFLEAFDLSRREQVESMLESDPVSSAVRSLMDINQTWEGSISDLAERLSKLTVAPKDIPVPRRLGISLRLAEANLRTVGIEVRFRKSGSQRIVSIGRIEHPKPRNSTPAPLLNWEVI